MSVFLSGCSNGGENGKENQSSSTKKTEKDGKPAPASKQVLHMASEGDISTMDVNHATDGVSLRALEETHSGLIRLDKDENPIPDMAARMPKVNKDKTVYTFTLRKDAKWSNGDPVTAQDFVYSWRKEVSKDTAGEYAYIFPSAGIKNAANILDPKSPLYNQPKKLGIKALDKHTLQVTLERPVPFFISLLSFPTFFPKDQKVVEKYGKEYATDADKMVYNGPFVMTAWNHGEGWSYKKNPKYWDADHIHLKKVNYKIVKEMSSRVNLYQTGQLDYTDLNTQYITQFENKPDLHKGDLSDGIIYLSLNQKVETLKNKDIRDAIYNAIDRKTLVKTLLKDGSSPAYYFVGKKLGKLPNGEDFREAHPTINKQSLKWAKDKWKQGLKKLGKNSVNLDLLIYEGTANKNTAEYLKAQLEKNLPGMHVHIKIQPLTQFIKLEDAGQFDIALDSWGPDYPDPMSDLDMWVTGGHFNHIGYSNSEYDRLIQKAKHLGGQPAKRMKAMQKAEKILLEDAPIVPLYQPAHAYLEKPYVKQFYVNRPGPNEDWTYTYIINH